MAVALGVPLTGIQSRSGSRPRAATHGTNGAGLHALTNPMAARSGSWHWLTVPATRGLG